MRNRDRYWACLPANSLGEYATLGSWRRERNWDRTFSMYICVVPRGTTQTDPGLSGDTVWAETAITKHEVRFAPSSGLSSAFL